MSSWRAVRGPLVLAALTAAPIFMWARALPLRVRFSGATASLDSIAVAFALAGVTAFALNILLGARLDVVQRFFGGLEALYRTHRANGRVAYVLIFVHVSLMTASRAVISTSDALHLFVPSAGKAIWFGVVAFALMTGALYLTLYVRLGHEVFVFVQRMLGAIFAIAILHVFLTPETKGFPQALTIYLAVLAGAALIAYAYRSLFGNVLIRRHTCLVTNVRELDPRVVEITMQPRGKPLHPIPGQFVFATFYSDEFNAQFHPVSFQPGGESPLIVVRPGEARDQFHPFSLTSTPSDTQLKLVVKAVGSFTRALHRLAPGAAAVVEGPYGEFSYTRVPSSKQIWIAGGIGITPFLSMARSLNGEAHDIRLCYCVKRRSEAHFLPELESIAARLPNFEAVLIADDEHGRPNVPMIEELTGSFEDKAVMLCGPPAMVTTLREQFQAAGVGSNRIFSERFGFGPKR